MSGKNTLLTYVNIAMIVVLIVMIYYRSYGPPSDKIEYKDFISIILTAIAVLLAAVTIMVALLAVWGYTSIRDGMEKVAQTVAAEIAREVAGKIVREVTEPMSARVAMATVREALGSQEDGDMTSALTNSGVGDGSQD